MEQVCGPIASQMIIIVTVALKKMAANLVAVLQSTRSTMSFGAVRSREIIGLDACAKGCCYLHMRRKSCKFPLVCAVRGSRTRRSIIGIPNKLSLAVFFQTVQEEGCSRGLSSSEGTTCGESGLNSHALTLSSLGLWIL
jgi:hypothetical protein